jgi:hypothetical protein
MRPFGAFLLSRQLSLGKRVRELAFARVCARCGCEYEWGVAPASRLTQYQPPARQLALIAVFAVVASTLIVLNRGLILRVRYEVGDFAANSLLVQDAKSLALFKGNYSRVGFNHPGPAILDVLAAGEAVFHDWLHLVPSGFGGQLIAICLYSAFWTALIAAMLQRSTKAAFATLWMLCIFLMATALCDFQFFSGAWFPHLYFFPFSAFTVAVARWSTGETDSVYALALSCGFLINGHVAFVAIAGVMAVTAVAINRISSGRAGSAAVARILSVAYFKTNKARLIRAALLLALFFVPLAIETALHWPGPIAKYCGYRAPHHSLGASLRFVNGYWGGGDLTLLYVVLLFGLLYFCARGEDYHRMIVGILTALFGATAALTLYAKVGIDDLGFNYVGLFYYAVPALTVATASYCLHEKVSFRGKRPCACAIILLSLTAVCWKAKEPPLYANSYDEQRVPAMYEKMHALGPTPLVLDLDNPDGGGSQWGHIWSTMVGIEAYAKRQHVALFCINKNWHVLFTEGAKCTEEQVRTGKPILVTTSGRPGPRGAAPLIDFLGLAFYPSEAVVLSGPRTRPSDVREAREPAPRARPAGSSCCRRARSIATGRSHARSSLECY